MKYIKLFENEYKLINGEHYTSLDNERLTLNDIDKLKDISSKYKLESQYSNIAFILKLYKSKESKVYKKYFGIRKISDDYYCVMVKESNGFNYYMCDQMRGLLSLIANKMKTK